MAKRIRAVFLALAAIVLALLLIITGSYALFTDQATIKNHLQAGTLEVTLTRLTLTGNKIDEKGYIGDYVNETDVDFSDETTENVFDFGENERIAPTSYRVAEMELKNGSDVAFAYWIEIVLTSELTDAEDIALAEQLEVSVTTENTEAKAEDQAISNQTIAVGSAESPVGVVELGQSKTFTVKVSFKDYGAEHGNANDNAKNGDLSFDMIVHAVQVTE